MILKEIINITGSIALTCLSYDILKYLIFGFSGSCVLVAGSAESETYESTPW